MYGEAWLLVEDPLQMQPLYLLGRRPSSLQLVSNHPQPTQPTNSEGGVMLAQKGAKNVELRLGPAC